MALQRDIVSIIKSNLPHQGPGDRDACSCRTEVGRRQRYKAIAALPDVMCFLLC